MRRRLVGIIAVLVTGCGGSPAPEESTEPSPAWSIGPWRTACRYDVTVLPELSGLAPSVRHTKTIWAVNDSGDDARIYALDANCRIRATVTIAGFAAVDVEALASGHNTAGEPTLWVADIGDNQAQRSTVSVWEVPEPDLVDRTVSAREHVVRFRGGPRDAEGLMVDRTGRRMWLVSKEIIGTVWQAPIRGGVATARKVDAAPLFATDSALNPAGDRYAIRTYANATAFAGPVPGTRVTSLRMPRQRQGEAIAFSRNGRFLYSAGEGEPKLSRARVVAP